MGLDTTIGLVGLISGLSLLAAGFWKLGPALALSLPLMFVGGGPLGAGAFLFVGTSLDGSFSSVATKVEAAPAPEEVSFSPSAVEVKSAPPKKVGGSFSHTAVKVESTPSKK
jgi:hypothetical protein